jgi:hypothetical protein
MYEENSGIAISREQRRGSEALLNLL